MKKNVTGYSLKLRILFAILALVLVQGLILICSITVTGAIQKNDTATYDILSRQSESRKNEIQELFNLKRKNITNLSVELNEKIDEILAEYDISMDDAVSDEEVFTRILDCSLGELVTFTKYNSVTGAFAVLDSPSEILSDKPARTCIYISDSSPGNIKSNNSNLLLDHGRVDLARNMDIAVNSLWSRDMSFVGGINRDFYYKPINAKLESTENYKIEAYGYWSAPFKKGDVTIITYSLPLVLGNGLVYGVIGFELETQYLGRLMPTAGIPYDKGLYLLSISKGDGINTDNIVSSGAYAKQFLSGVGANIFYKAIYSSKKVYEITNELYPEVKALGTLDEIGLYETYSPFFGEKWSFTCMAPEDSVMYGSNTVKQAIIVSILSSVVLAVVLAVFAASFIFGPIRRLSERVKSIDPEMPVRFDKTGIREIDELSGAFEVLSDGVSEAAAKMFTIIELVDMPLGSFEISHRDNKVHMSKSLFKLLGFKMPDDNSDTISSNDWNGMIEKLDKEKSSIKEDGITETLYMADKLFDQKKWLQIRLISDNTRDIGVLIDVTDEVLQKQRLEFERNNDPLTKLYNRHAFMDKSYEVMRENPHKVGIMMFADLDDLKFVNDSYGHETGDSYIIKFADFLKNFREMGAIVGRVSGDEFVMFMNGYSSREEAKKAFSNVFADVNSLAIETPEGTQHRLRVSVGLSYYPSDSTDLKELVKYADYAMYEIKHSIKGEIQEFNIKSYNKNAFVLNMKDLLNLFIDDKRVRFAFQPIVDVKTGDIFAYEALMRSMMRELKTPDEILKVARSQSKLYQVEKVTFHVVFDWIENNADLIRGKKIFVNSIPNQIFTESDKDEICGKYSYLFKRVVFEVTENEFSNIEDTKEKMDLFKSYGSQIAIDDYGSGYSNELALLLIEPDFLKIDMSIVRNIDRDNDKQQLVQNIISYAHKKGIKVIAEGIETHREMEVLVRFGADYIQGYYFAKPNFNILTELPDDIREELLALSCG